jgi:oligoribonuclease NrnB/cAMP/cGMP phosphodiesterase (DHH superfamily)
MTRPYIITHGEDPDGIIAHALLMRALELDSTDPSSQFFARYDRLLTPFSKVKRKLIDDPAEIYVADIAVSPVLERSKWFDAMSDSYITWFDHHTVTAKLQDDLIEKGVDVHYSASQCAAMLVHRAYLLGDENARGLAKIAQAHDFRSVAENIGSVFEMGDKLEDVICLANAKENNVDLFNLTCAIATDSWREGETQLTKRLENQYDEAQTAKKQAFSKLQETVQVEEIEGYRFLFAYADPILSQKPAPRFLRDKYEKEADVFVSLFAPPCRNHILDARADVPFDVIDFVESTWGGGGRRTNTWQGAGFSLEYNITRDNFESTKKRFIEEAKNYISSHRDSA